MTGEFRRASETFTLAGVDYEFMFADRGGALATSSASPFAPKSVSGERSYADYDPMSAVAFVDLSGGMGQERATDTTAYYDANNIDARGGRLVLGPLVSYNQSETPGLVGGSALATSRLRNPATTSLSSLAIDAGAGHGTLAAPFTPTAGMSKLRRVWLPLAILAGASTITVTIRSTSAGNPDSTLATTTIAADERNPNGAWTPAVFAADVAITPGTQYWVAVAHTGAAGQLAWHTVLGSSTGRRWNGAAWLNAECGLLWYHDGRLRPDSPPTFLAWAGKDLAPRIWSYAGEFLYYHTAPANVAVVQDGGDPAAPKQMAAQILDAVAYHKPADDYATLYLALGESEDIATFDGYLGVEGWDTLSGLKARALAVHDGLLWRAYSNNQVDADSVGDFASPGTAVSVGDKSFPIKKMTSWNGNLYVGKADGLYKVVKPTGYPATGTPTVQRVLDFSSQYDTRNFSCLCEYQGDLIFPISQGLLKFTNSDVLTVITPETGLNLATSERSYYRALASSLNVLWAASEGPIGSPSTILAYVDGHWHPLISLARTGEMVRSIAIDCLYAGTPNLWFGTGLLEAFCTMPTTTQKRWLFSASTWAEEGYLDLSWVDGNIRTIDKDWIEIQLDLDDVGDGEGEPAVAIYWRPDESTAWAQVGADITAEGISFVQFAAATYGPKLQLRVFLIRGTLGGATKTPQVHAVVVKYLERPQDSRAFTRTYLLSERLVYRNGVQVAQSITEQMANLETLRNAKEPLTWTTWYGAQYSVHVVNYACSEIPQGIEEGEAPGYILATLQLQRVP